MKNDYTAIEWAIRHKGVPLAIAFVLVALGIYGLFNMPRNEFPDFTIRQGLLIGYYPGASAAQVEEQLTTKVEDYLFTFSEIDKTKTYSFSRDGMMYEFVEINGKLSDGDTKAFWNKLKNGVLVLQQTSLPKEVRGILVNSDFGSTSAILVSVESKTRTYMDLQRHVEEIEDNLRTIKNVAKISHSGNLKEQLGIYIDQNKLVHYGISAGSILRVLQNEGAVTPAGTMDGNTIDRPVHLTSFFQTQSDLAKQIIQNDGKGNVVRLCDVATIKKEYDDPDSYVTNKGTKSIIISMEMAVGKNIVQFGKEVNDHLAGIGKTLPSDIVVSKLADQPNVVDDSISHFMKEFSYALIGVIIVVLLLLPLRVAAVAAATIPITISATLAIMYMAGIELDTVTLAALVIVLGIVVDDPIVVIDNHIEKLDHGLSVWDAARSSARELFPSVFTATLAISATFAPLALFMTGVAKDFISVFPYTIMIALFLSLMISMLIVPFFNTLFIRKGLHAKAAQKAKKGPSFLDRLQSFFNSHIGNAIKYWKTTIALGIVAVLSAFFLMGFLEQQLFPKIDRNQFSIEITLPYGYHLDQTDSVVKGMERIMAQDKRVIGYTSFIGNSSPRFHTVYAPNLPSRNYAQILVTTTDDKSTEEVLDDYQRKYSNKFPAGYVRMKQLAMNNALAPIEVRLSGENIDQLKDVAGQVKRLAQNVPHITWIRTDYGEQQEGIKLDIRNDEAARIGLSKSDIANTLAMNLDGITATQVWEGKYPLDVRLKADNYHRASFSDLENLSIVSPLSHATVPLRQVAEIGPDWHEGQIVRRNGVRTLTVRMDIDQQSLSSTVMKSLKPVVAQVKLPDGVNLAFGGEEEIQKENDGPMGLALLMSLVILFLILVWHFKRLKHALLSFLTMPLSLFGAVSGLLLMRYPFGFTAFIGILALCGIVVRNGIILIDFADEVREKEGLTVRDAAVHAAERRMRPIFLTSSAAAVGVIPMILSRSSLWGPLGTVICFGLLFSMVLTLLILPVLYWSFFRKEDNVSLKEAGAQNA